MTLFLKKVIAAGVAGATILGALGAATAPASARDGGAVAAGVIGGLAAGAIIGSAAANANPGYYAPAYAPPPPPPPAYGGCYFTRQPMYDAYGQYAGSRRVRVCD